jgi:hypothetical protein
MYLRSAPALSRTTHDSQTNSPEVTTKNQEELIRSISFSSAGQNVNSFLKNLCSLHQGSEILRSFLLVVWKDKRGGGVGVLTF